jgi:hypothetical protein
MPEEVRQAFYSLMPGSQDTTISAATSADPGSMPDIHRAADNLGMFIGSGNTARGEPANWCCSDVRLTEDLFLTSWHCGAASGREDAAYWQAGTGDDTCASAIVDMSWDEDGIGREYGCRKVEYQDKALDVAVLRLGRLADGLPLSRPLHQPVMSTEPLRAGQALTVLHHPACKPKSLTRGCTVLDPNVASWVYGGESGTTTEFTHNCTTERGSSGGPVFSEGMALIGIHHLGEDRNQRPGNVAVSLSAILDGIGNDNPALLEEIVDVAQ